MEELKYIPMCINVSFTKWDNYIISSQIKNTNEFNKIYIYIYVMSHKKDKVEIILFLKTNK